MVLPKKLNERMQLEHAFREFAPNGSSRLHTPLGSVKYGQPKAPKRKKGIDMKIRGTDFVMFQVTDMPKAVRFYQENE